MTRGPSDPARTTAALFAALDAAVERRALRRLDVAFARFVAETSPDAPPAVLLGAALVAQVEGRGHSCLSLDEAAEGAEALLGSRVRGSGLETLGDTTWPSTGEAWRAALAGGGAVAVDPVRSAPLATGAASASARPLVLAGPRLYLRRYWDYERRVAAQVLARAAHEPAIDPAAVRTWLDALFGEASPNEAFDWQKAACALALRGRLAVVTGGPGTGKTYTAARLLAALFATAPDPERLRVALAAPTGKAAARLKQSIDDALQGLARAVGDRLPLARLAARVGAARTLHALLGARPDTRRFRHRAGHPLEVDVLIVDEASMVHLEMMDALLDALPSGARLVLLGDKDQLASVEAGAVLGDLCRDASAGRYDDATAGFLEATTGRPVPPERRDASGPLLAQRTTMLRRSQRFGGAIGALALAVNEGRDADALACFTQVPPGLSAPSPELHWIRGPEPDAVPRLAVRGRDGIAGQYADYLGVIARRPADGDEAARLAWAGECLRAFDAFRVLSAVRDGAWGVAGLNRAIEQALADAGLLAPRGEWYEGRPVIVTRNDPSLGVFNGDIGIALRVPVGPGTGGDVSGSGGAANSTSTSTALRVFFAEGPRVRSVSVGRLADVETAFAMTVHKSQGSEFGHTVLVLPPEHQAPATRELVYTGITRARQAFTLVTPTAATLSAAIQRTTRRASGLQAWWTAAR
jgi:exodeoxyribonuclease V alpha subunit